MTGSLVRLSAREFYALGVVLDYAPPTDAPVEWLPSLEAADAGTGSRDVPRDLVDYGIAVAEAIDDADRLGIRDSVRLLDRLALDLATEARR